MFTLLIVKLSVEERCEHRMFVTNYRASNFSQEMHSLFAYTRYIFLTSPFQILFLNFQIINPTTFGDE